jgi:hypothetical protein
VWNCQMVGGKAVVGTHSQFFEHSPSNTYLKRERCSRCFGKSGSETRKSSLPVGTLSGNTPEGSPFKNDAPFGLLHFLTLENTDVNLLCHPFESGPSHTTFLLFNIKIIYPFMCITHERKYLKRTIDMSLTLYLWTQYILRN